MKVLKTFKVAPFLPFFRDIPGTSKGAHARVNLQGFIILEGFVFFPGFPGVFPGPGILQGSIFESNAFMATRRAKTKLPAAVKKLWAKGKAQSMPKDVPPMLATLVTEPPEGEGWRYEMKWDGYRCLVYLDGGQVELRSRNNKSFNEKYYPLVRDFEKLGVEAVIDGEIVVVNAQGIPDFANLQLWRSEADGHLLFYAFDLLWLDGHSVTELPIEDRRSLLKAHLDRHDPGE